MSANVQKSWEEYREAELRTIKPLLEEAGFALDEEQVHTRGERYLTKDRDVGGGGMKLVLTGTRKADGARVIVKASSDPQGIQEIERERLCREQVHEIPFALRDFKTPEELYYGRHGNYVISVTKYIEQERSFFEHTLQEQFFLALRAFETQEGVHATTHAHAARIKDIFGGADVDHYLSQFSSFQDEAVRSLPDRTGLAKLFERAQALLREQRTRIARYCGFLTHADFVPNNLRIAGNDVFLLDFSSVYFGNKYESWARFINFMTDHHPALGDALSAYVRANRGEEEYTMLRLMRIYKIGFLLAYYAKALPKTTGDLRALTENRLELWNEVMEAMLDDRKVSGSVVAKYVEQLPALRSEEEKARQRELLGVDKLDVQERLKLRK